MLWSLSIPPTDEVFLWLLRWPFIVGILDHLLVDLVLGSLWVCIMLPRCERIRPTMSLSLSSLDMKAFSKYVGMLRLGSHRLFPLELPASHFWTTITSWWPSEWTMPGCGVWPSECECSTGGVVAFLFLLKTNPKVVSSSCSVEVWATIFGAFFGLRDSSGILAIALILFAISFSSFLFILDNILSAKKTSEWLITIVKLVTPRIGNGEYRYKPSEHRECTISSEGRKCQMWPLGSSRICRPPDLMVAGRTDAEHSRIWVSGSNTKETRLEGSDLPC